MGKQDLQTVFHYTLSLLPVSDERFLLLRRTFRQIPTAQGLLSPEVLVQDFPPKLNRL